MVRIYLWLIWLSFFLFYYLFFLWQGVGPDVDCEIDDDSDEPNYTGKKKNCKKYKYLM